MDLWHPSIKKHFFIPTPLNCSRSPGNWVYVENGRCFISSAASKRYGNITCKYRPLVRLNDNMQTFEKAISSFQNETPVVSDFFEAQCVSSEGITYRNLHPAIKVRQSAVDRAKGKQFPKTALGLDVLMFGFDSVSRLNWLRNLPKTYAYFSDVLDGVTLEGYNIVGDGTPQALLPILTGRTEEELPEARRAFPGARTVDDHPWIWNDFTDAGYVTQWGEDGAGMGTFNYRMLGFSQQPVDHYYRPYQLQAERQYYKNNSRYCMGSEPRLNVMLKWIQHFFDAYPKLPKFSFLFHSEYSHGSFSMLSMADETLTRFLYDMKAAGHLNNTLLVLMADHGARFVKLRNTQQGKYEERLPYFSFALPKWFAKKYPMAMKNLKNNRKMLTVPFDIHETFKDLLNYTDLGDMMTPSRGISLFQTIPANRTCSDADIAPHWCTCMEWTNTSLSDELVILAANQIVNTINDLTNTTRHLCAYLTLDRIEAAVKYSPNKRVLQFKKSADTHGRRADLTDKMTADREFYQLSIETRPGGGLFEATVTHDMFRKDSFGVNTKEISRINRYGDQPHCIRDTLPHLRPYCYCKNQLN
ncbi:hypothetical protein LSH36_687g03049 [Paralvinella palmiformis]|uniref:DUF229 domain containing protein n=1 Tax=Paralvinella palmiformis TaxID=53620 RepID=A0AAD9MVH1_9ANNE|nr:hypothetical protein LSH36_687g03049 [Paralvinella palmiformis]